MARPDEPLQREPLTGRRLVVYRVVHVEDEFDPQIVDDFKSNADKNRSPKGREQLVPEIHEGLSVYRTREQAEAMRRLIVERLRRAGRTEPLRIGDYVARVELLPGRVAFEDLGEPDGHLTIWGEPSELARMASDIKPAA